MSHPKPASNVKELLADNPLYGEHNPEPTVHSPTLDVTLHKLDNPLYESGTADDSRASAIYSELNPAYHTCTRANELMARNGDLEPYAYARLHDYEKPTENPDSTHQYDYASTNLWSRLKTDGNSYIHRLIKTMVYHL